ncbi:hypothetical protein H1R20_g2867, partial [Candolleomyces eurysporus]
MASNLKRRVREDANPTPSPTKKKSRNALTPVSPGVLTQAPAASTTIVDSDDEDSSSVADLSVTGSADSAGDGDIEDEDQETPKASKVTGKKKAGNLKTQLGGKLGVNLVGDDTVFGSAAPAAKAAPIGLLPSADFTLENKASWAGSWVEGHKTHLFVKAHSSDDPLLARQSILDPYMVKHGHYKNLPKANMLQLVSIHETQGLDFTDGSLTSLVPGLSISSWECFGINKEYLASLLRCPSQGQIINPSTVDVTDLIFKEVFSFQGAGSAYIACNKDNCLPVVFVMVGAIMESFVVQGRNVGIDGKGPFAKGVVMLNHRLEYERQSCTFATLWQGEAITAPIQRRLITFQTKNRPNNITEKPVETEIKVGKMDIKSYASPTKRHAGRPQTSIDFADDSAYGFTDLLNVAESLAGMARYKSDDGEIPEGTGAVIGYSAATSKFMSSWKLTFYVQWIVVIAD